MFHSDREHKGIEHIFIGLVVCHEESSIYMQADILTFVESIEVDLKKVRDMHEVGLDQGRRCSYCLLLAYYRDIMAIPTDPPYCLVYPIMYHKNAEDKSHFNTSTSPSGMHTCVCMCRALLQHVDMEPLHQRTFEGSHLIIPHSAQYRTLFLEIIALCNHWGLLIDPEINEPFPMFTVGDFCLKDKIFPSTYGHSLLFIESDLTKLKEKDIYIPPYKEESCKVEETCKTEESHKTSGQISTASSPELPDSISSKKSSKERQPPTAKERPDYHESEDGCTSRHKERSCREKSGKPEPDKESGSTIHEWWQSPFPGIDSIGCKCKESCTEALSNTPHESSHDCPRSPSICLRELQDCSSFSVPASASTPIRCSDQLHCRLASTDSRLSVTPMDSSVYSSFNFYGQPGVGRGGATPSVMSLVVPQQVSSIM